MNKKILLFTFTVGLLYISLSSYVNGPAAHANSDYTGRPGSFGTCKNAGCHTGGPGTTTCTIEIRSKGWGDTTAIVNSFGFIPNRDYTVTIKGTNASLAKFGFQLSAVSGTASAGTFSGFPANVHEATGGGIKIVEHSSPLSKDGSGNYVATFSWKSPTSSSPVTFYGIINAVNDNNSTAGDDPSSSVNFTMQDASSVANINGRLSIKAYPNPVAGNYLNLQIENAVQGNYTINAYNVAGSHIYHTEVFVNSKQVNTAINTERWAAGVYVLHIHDGSAQKMITIVKQ